MIKLFNTKQSDTILVQSNKLAHQLAVKMMFNYDVESNSTAILKAMYRETVPAMSYFFNQNLFNIEKLVYNNFFFISNL